MANTIHLNGGPWHGQVVAIPDDRDHFHIIMPVLSPPEFQQAENPSGIETREGTYSQVRGLPGEYEWDGWVSHD